MSKAYITDYIENPDVEQGILGDALVSDVEAHRNAVEAIIVWHQKVDQAYIDSFPALKGIVRYGVGFDNLDLDYARSKGIYACNTPDYGTEEVCDSALALILNIARGVTRYDYLCRSYPDGSWQENTLTKLRRTSELTLGVVGAGRIGGSILLKARNLRFKTMLFDPYKERGHEKVLGAARAETLDDLLETADIVSMNTPLTEETRHLVDEDFVSRMKPGASFVNTSRGEVVKDVDVFYEPLKSGKLDCVALDVLPHEPPVESKLIKAWRAREEWLDGRLTINPHVSYYSQQAFSDMRSKAAANALRILKGETPYNILNGVE